MKAPFNQLGEPTEFFNASSRQEIDAAFESFVRERPDLLFVSTDTFFSSRRVHLDNLATRHAIPTGFPNREAAEIGGLVSHGSFWSSLMNPREFIVGLAGTATSCTGDGGQVSC
jgi:hypothetical protein